MPRSNQRDLISQLLHLATLRTLIITIALLLFIGAIVQWFGTGEASILRASIIWILAALVIPVIVTTTTFSYLSQLASDVSHRWYIQLTGAHLGFALSAILSAVILIGVLSLFGEQVLRQSISIVLFITFSLSTLISFLTARSQLQSAEMIIQKHGQYGRELFNVRSLLIVHTGAMILTCAPLFLLMLPAIPISNILAIPGAIACAVSLFLLSLLGSFNKPQPFTQPATQSDEQAFSTAPNSPKQNDNPNEILPFLADVLQRKLNLDEVKALSFELAIDYDELEGQTKSTKVIALLQYLERRNLLGELYETLRRKRPDIDLSELDV